MTDHETPTTEPARRPRRTDGFWKYVDNPTIVLAVTFLVAAGFALPLIWASRGFTPLAKVILTVVVSIYTVMIVALIVLMLMWIGQQFSQFL